MLLLYNESYLDLVEEKASSFIKKEVYDFINDIFYDKNDSDRWEYET